MAWHSECTSPNVTLALSRQSKMVVGYSLAHAVCACFTEINDDAGRKAGARTSEEYQDAVDLK